MRGCIWGSNSIGTVCFSIISSHVIVIIPQEKFSARNSVLLTSPVETSRKHNSKSHSNESRHRGSLEHFLMFARGKKVHFYLFFEFICS